MKVLYQDINGQLQKYYNLAGIRYSVPIGFNTTVLKNDRFVFGAGVHGSINTPRHSSDDVHLGSIRFNRLTYSAKAGLPFFLIKSRSLVPYLGLALESLQVEPDLNYGVKAFDCFFRTDNTYRIRDLTGLIGIILCRRFALRGESSLLVSCDVGTSLPITHDRWIVNGEQVEYPDYDYEPDVPHFQPGAFIIQVQMEYLLFGAL